MQNPTGESASPWRKATLLFFALIALALVAQLQAQEVQTQPEVKAAVRHDISLPLREMPQDLLPLGIQQHRMIPLGHKPALWATNPSIKPDALVEHIHAAPVGATIKLNFDGLSNVDQVAPPDTNGSVGDTQFVEWVNLSFAVYDKKSGALIEGPVEGNTLWKGFGGACEADNDGDILVTFDKMAHRWVFTQFALNNFAGPFLQCFAVSTSSDATGKFNRYAFVISENQLNDYPKIGVWPDAYYMSFNMFGNGAAKVCALERAKMLLGAHARQVCFQRHLPDFSLLPSDLDGSTRPAAGEPNFFVELDQSQQALNLFRFHVDFAFPHQSTFVGPFAIHITPWSFINAIAEPSPGEALDSLGDRLMYRLAYRNFLDHEALVVAHTVDRGDSLAGVRWYEIRDPNGVPTLFQESTFADADAVNLWMPSMAMDRVGNILLGYSRAGATVDPGVSITGRKANDPLGVMQGPKLVVAGTGVQQNDGGRWGDYASMSLDPIDDCTLWFATEYIKTTGSDWSTRVTAVKFPSCR